MISRRLALAALIGGAAAGPVAWLGARRRAGRPPAQEPVVIARLKTPHAGLVHIADDRGYFAEQGLATTINDLPTGYEAMTEVFAGRADFATPAETPVARALAEGKEPRIAATIFQSQWNSAVVARRDRGIAQATDLKGRRIGFVFGTATHYMLETFLAFHAIPLESVTLIARKPDEIGAAVLAGELDAASLWTPFLTRLQQSLGERGVTFLPRDFYAETCNLVVRSGYLDTQRDKVDRVLRALMKAEDYARSRPDAAVQVVAAVSGIDAATLKGNGDPLTFELSLQQSLLLALENEVRWYFRRGLVPTRPFPDVLRAIETEPLRALKPEAVGIAR